MPTTYRLDKGLALTYQELDDNFREAAGNPNVRWLKIKSAELDQTLNIIPSNGNVETFLKWKTIAHTDATTFFVGSNKIVLLLL